MVADIFKKRYYILENLKRPYLCNILLNSLYLRWLSFCIRALDV